MYVHIYIYIYIYTPINLLPNIYIYIYIHIYIYGIFIQSLQKLNFLVGYNCFEISVFFWTGYLTNAREINLPYYMPIAKKRKE